MYFDSWRFDKELIYSRDMKEGIIMVNKIYDRYDAIAFDQKRYIRSEMKELIFEKHLYRDFTQSIYEGAIIARNS